MGLRTIGDVSWNVPSVTLQYPRTRWHVRGTIGGWHSDGNPVAHKGAVVGAKVQALSLSDGSHRK
jgi:hypothetical protein